MKDVQRSHLRRRLLAAGLAAPALLFPGWRAAAAQADPLPATPACSDEPTAQDYEGPFFKPRSPLRSSLREAGISGDLLVLTGFVVSRSCQPLAGAVLDFWHCDAHGDYDNKGYRLRGHQMTDAAGRYRLETILPGEYPGRTRHIHVKVQAKGGRLLTSQLYFPGNASNERDSMFNPELLMKMADRSSARFDFVLVSA
jgi:protocatechuate 3,4-dioxygenase beta subunit